MVRVLTTIALGLLLSQLGCTGGTSGAVELPVFPVQGKTTLDGMPYEGVSLFFSPTGTTQGTGGYGISGADGAFELTSMDGRKGIPEGRYNVVATRLTLPDGSPIPRDASAADVGAVNKLPEGYGDPSRSPLSVKVQAAPNTDVLIELKSRFVPKG